MYERYMEDKYMKDVPLTKYPNTLQYSIKSLNKRQTGYINNNAQYSLLVIFEKILLKEGVVVTC